MASNTDQGSSSRANTGQKPQPSAPIGPSPNQPSSSSRPLTPLSPRPPKPANQSHQFSHLQPNPSGHQYPVDHIPGGPSASVRIADARGQIPSVESMPHDPSSRQAQDPRLPPPPAYNIPGADSHPSQTSAVPNQRGVIKPPTKFRKRHKRLWKAQSTENVQLWNTVDQLHSEIDASKARIVKLEAEISTLKEAAKVFKSAVENPPSKKSSKRSRSKLSVGTDDMHRPKAQGGKHRQSCEAQKEGSAIVSKPDDQEETSHPLSITPQEDRNVPPTITQSSGEFDGSGFKDKEDASSEPDAVIPSVKNPNEETLGIKVTTDTDTKGLGGMQ